MRREADGREEEGEREREGPFVGHLRVGVAMICVVQPEAGATHFAVRA